MKKLSVFIHLFLFFLVTTVFLSYYNRIISHTVLAWETTQSAQSECSAQNTVKIRVSFTNNEPDRAMNVKVEDQQTAASTDLGTIDVGQTKTADIQTDRESLLEGKVIFFLTWSDGGDGSDQREASYKAISCAKPTPTITHTPSPTETPIPTPTPTLSPTPEPTSTPAPSPSPTIVPTSTPTPTPTNTSVVTTNIVYVQVQPTPTPQVLAAVDIKELPKTGANMVNLLGLLSLFPLGVFLRNKGSNVLEKIKK